MMLNGCAKQQGSLPAETIITEDGQVFIAWNNPADYTDVEATLGVQSKYQQYLFSELTEELGKVANKHLSPNQKLELVVTNVDLAGDVQPTFGATPHDIRILEDIYPPKITFDYTLSENNTVLKTGSEKLRDIGYLSGIQPIGNDPFPYEVDLLTDWFKETIKPVLSE